jgi:predicted Zn finger-like uncharacterized protein
VGRFDRSVEEVQVVITCPQCETQYRYDEARFGAVQRKRVKCPKCANVFEVDNPTPDEGDATSLGRKTSAVALPIAGGPKPRSAEPEAPELPELAPLPKDMRFSLAVIAGAQAGSVFPVAKPRIFIGRGSSMDVQLKDAEVSRRHCMLEIRDDDGTLIDLGTTNGTFVAGERIDQSELANQSEFTVGSTTMMFIVTHSRDTGV